MNWLDFVGLWNDSSRSESVGSGLLKTWVFLIVAIVHLPRLDLVDLWNGMLMQFNLSLGSYPHGPVLVYSRPLLFGAFAAGLWLVAIRAVAVDVGFRPHGIHVFLTQLHVLRQHVIALRMFGAGPLERPRGDPGGKDYTGIFES